MWKYLKTVDFINTIIFMFKINLFYPIEYRQRIRNYMTLNMKVKVILDKWHLKTIEWTISDSLWICESNRRSICNFTRPWLDLPLPICINCRALAWEWVYVYKLAFFFWLSPRTYHFLFEKRLIIDWRYFWQNIALSLILWVSPDYPLNGYINNIILLRKWWQDKDVFNLHLHLE